MTTLPIEIWLIVFDSISDIDTLWSVIRNVSRSLRACVDEFFRRNILRETVLDLIYSTIHRHQWPIYQLVHVPMRFDRLSDNGTRAVFRQVRVNGHSPTVLGGSVRGWVPFIERYCKETKKPKPRTMNKSKSTAGRPVWEKTYRKWCSELHRIERSRYIYTLRNHTSIGRGDRPPYSIRLPPYSHDTAIVGLQIDCSASEISFDWRRTLSAFFMEAHFVSLAAQRPDTKREYDRAIERAAKDILFARCSKYDNRNLSDWRRARRKRLQPWVARHWWRMASTHRLLTEDFVFGAMELFNREEYALHNLVELQDYDVDTAETVPEKCARDRWALMKWPVTRKERKELEDSAFFCWHWR